MPLSLSVAPLMADHGPLHATRRNAMRGPEMSAYLGLCITRQVAPTWRLTLLSLQ